MDSRETQLTVSPVISRLVIYYIACGEYKTEQNLKNAPSTRGRHQSHHNHAKSALLPSDVKNDAIFRKCCPLMDVWRETVRLLDAM